MVQPPGAGGQVRDAGKPPIHYYITSIRDPRWNPLSQTLYTPLDLNLNPIHHFVPILEIMQCSGSTLHSMTFCRFQKKHLAWWCSRKIEGGCGFCRNIHGFPCKREHKHCVSSQTVIFTFHRAGSPQQRSWDSMIQVTNRPKIIHIQTASIEAGMLANPLSFATVQNTSQVRAHPSFHCLLVFLGVGQQLICLACHVFFRPCCLGGAQVVAAQGEACHSILRQGVTDFIRMWIQKAVALLVLSLLVALDLLDLVPKELIAIMILIDSKLI